MDSSDCNECKGFGTSPATTRWTTGYLFELLAHQKKISLSSILWKSEISRTCPAAVWVWLSLSQVSVQRRTRNTSPRPREIFSRSFNALHQPLFLAAFICICIYLYFFVFLCLTLSLLKCCSPDQLFLANWPLLVVVQLHCSQNCLVNQLLYACILYYVFSFKHN